MMDEGFYSKLIVPTPPITIPSWPCLFSGVTPYQLGYYWFNHPDKGIFNSLYWREKAIFSLPEIKSFVLNVPGTYPAWIIHGEMIAGMLSPKFSSSPDELSQKYKQKWIIDGRTIDQIFQAFEIKKKIFLDMLDKDYNLLIYVIRMPDAISHMAHKTINKTLNSILQSYEKIDEFLGHLLSANEIDNIFVVSDHGMTTYYKELNLYRWLEKKKLLYINNLRFKWFKLFIMKIFDIIRPLISERILGKTKHWIKKRKRGNQTITPESEFKTVSDDKTEIQSFNSNVGGLFLNAEHKSLRTKILELLNQESFVKKIIEPKINGFPDAFIILKDQYIFGDKPSPLLYRKRNVINHSEEGLFIAYGKNVKKGSKESLIYLNLVPTILRLFKIKQSESMIGKVMDTIISDDT